MVVYRCDKCEKIMTDIKQMHTVQAMGDRELSRYDMCEDCFNKLAEWIRGNEPAERDCEHCIHHKDKGCESWECHFERRTDGNSN